MRLCLPTASVYCFCVLSEMVQLLLESVNLATSLLYVGCVCTELWEEVNFTKPPLSHKICACAWWSCILLQIFWTLKFVARYWINSCIGLLAVSNVVIMPWKLKWLGLLFVSNWETWCHFHAVVTVMRLVTFGSDCPAHLHFPNGCNLCLNNVDWSL